jgi:hypothetical protein
MSYLDENDWSIMDGNEDTSTEDTSTDMPNSWLDQNDWSIMGGNEGASTEGASTEDTSHSYYDKNDDPYALLPRGAKIYTYEEDGSRMVVDENGDPIRALTVDSEGRMGEPKPDTGESAAGKVIDFFKSLPGKTAETLKARFTKNVNGQSEIDWGAIAKLALPALGGLYGLYESRQRLSEPVGYQGKVEDYTAIREAVPYTYDPNRRPGSSGQNYFTDTRYVKSDDAAGIEAARAAARSEAAGIAALNRSNPAREFVGSPTEQAAWRGAQSEEVRERKDTPRDASEVIKDLPIPKFATGGILALARGGEPRYLNGSTDGMEDKVPARIDGGQEARLSHGEFVVPADVVSHLGNGNSESGAQRLYDMMDRIRKARTGTTKQGKQVDPNKFMPA